MLENKQIGIDIVKIDRFREKSIFENESLYEKIFTKSEMTYCKKFSDHYPHFAGKFALKEAVQKSIKKSLVFNKIETLHSNSKPEIKLHNSKNCAVRGDLVVYLSTSYELPLSSDTILNPAGLLVAPGFKDINATSTFPKIFQGQYNK